MVEFLQNIGATPGRGGYRAASESGAMVDRLRRRIGELTGASPQRVLLSSGCTAALNIAIGGLFCARRGRPLRIVTTNLEHNAVRRTLAGWATITGAEAEIIVCRCNGRGFVSVDEVIDRAQDADALAITGASNVIGAIQPVGEIGRALKAEGSRAMVIVDAAQTAGLVEIDIDRDGIDALAFAGHKALLGPPGTGALCLSERAAGELPPVSFGGTGALSASLGMPEDLPDRLEPGTPNTPGAAGLLAALEDGALPTGRARLEAERAHMGRLLATLAELPVRVLAHCEPASGALDGFTPVISFAADGADAMELAAALDASFGVAARAGLHCAPDAHRAFGTYEGGAVRLSPGLFTTADDIEICCDALRRLLS